MKTRKLATSPSLEGIAKLINKYFYSDSYTVTPELVIIRGDGKTLCSSYRVVQIRGGFKFEMDIA